MIYLCPTSRLLYEPSETRDADGAPDLRWARCTACDAHGRVAGQDGYNPDQGQWHAVPVLSLINLMHAVGQLAALRAMRRPLAEAVAG